jgi:hypothetical protein
MPYSGSFLPYSGLILLLQRLNFWSLLSIRIQILKANEAATIYVGVKRGISSSQPCWQEDILATMNVFEMMMGASKKRSKPTPAPIEAIAPVIKKKLRRPPAVKKAVDLTPLVTDLTVPKKSRVRVGYDRGDFLIENTHYVAFAAFNHYLQLAKIMERCGECCAAFGKCFILCA